MTIKYMNDITTFVSFVSHAIELLPKIVAVGNTIDAMNREHEVAMSQRYSEQEYLKTILALYQSHKISAEEARKALNLIFRDKPSVTYDIANASDIEQQIYKLLR